MIQNKEKPFEWEKISTYLVHQMSDNRLLANIKELPVVQQAIEKGGGWGLIAELCKRFKTHSDDKSIESLQIIPNSGVISPFILKHDKKEKCFTINYSPTIRDYRGLAENEEDYSTIFDANIGAICNFIKSEFKKYSEIDENDESIT